MCEPCFAMCGGGGHYSYVKQSKNINPCQPASSAQADVDLNFFSLVNFMHIKGHFFIIILLVHSQVFKCLVIVSFRVHLDLGTGFVKPWQI